MKVRLQSLPYGLRLLLATLSLGIGTGLVGIACHYLLEGVQGLAFGQASSDLLQQFQEAGGLRRFLVLCVTGCLASIGEIADVRRPGRDDGRGHRRLV